ncbi:hypothetical protein BH11PLA2_BH11PLA2_39990 [soil metagenome]
MAEPVTSARARRSSWVRLGLIAVVLTAAAGGYYAYVVSSEGTVPPVDQTTTLRESAKRLKTLETLASTYTDIDGDLLADAPTDPAKWLNPAELTFTIVAQDDPAEAEKIWKPFLDHLAVTTGKPVKYLKQIPVKGNAADPEALKDRMEDVRSVEMQIDAMRDGLLHVTAFNTGAVPLAVNSAGFHPLFAPADEKGVYDYQMQIIVPGNSPIKEVKDLKGATLGLVALSSNSGGRAPLVILKEKFDLTPGKDYQFVFTGRHETSITTLAAGKSEPNFQAACVASDILQQMLADQTIDTSRVRVIYSSSSFPKLAFGVPYNLAPELRANVAKAFATFRFTGPLAKKFDAEKRVKFAPIQYSKAFADVLTINAKMAELYATAGQK